MYHFELKPFAKTNWSSAQEWEKEVEKIFDVFHKGETFAPFCDITEEEKSFRLCLDVPGISKNDLDIEVKDKTLVISGERKKEVQAETSSLLRSERKYGKFSRSFNLPQNVNSELIEARFENGVLEITLPKEEKSRPKKIQITDWKKEDVLPELKS